jgi:L-ascorbate metabolism protein UlaG (beta-lactamase superfamily)
MRITKIGHCCLVIETDGVKVMTDPGSFSTGQESVTGLDSVIITHEHGDHMHVESVQAVLKNNPNAILISNSSVAKLLAEKGIMTTVIEGTATGAVKNVRVEALDAKHEEIYEDFGQVQNTGYFIGSLFYPGDAFPVVQKQVDVLALPVAGPWCRLRDAVRFALTVKPKHAFPVHDGMLQLDKLGLAHGVPSSALPANGLLFTPLKAGEVLEL